MSMPCPARDVADGHRVEVDAERAVQELLKNRTLGGERVLRGILGRPLLADGIDAILQRLRLCLEGKCQHHCESGQHERHPLDQNGVHGCLLHGGERNGSNRPNDTRPLS
jgi:hypothetical protein